MPSNTTHIQNDRAERLVEMIIGVDTVDSDTGNVQFLLDIYVPLGCSVSSTYLFSVSQTSDDLDKCNPEILCLVTEIEPITYCQIICAYSDPNTVSLPMNSQCWSFRVQFLNPVSLDP
jgi:hypothetical protein